MIENNVNTWSEAIAALDDKQFFSIIRLYLGEVKTPYNKQRLTSQLASFVKNKDTTKAILSFLDDFDKTILSAINLIPNITLDLLINFFSGTYSPSIIYSKVINLSERLLIYSQKEEYSSKEILFINPFLMEALTPYLSISRLLYSPEKVSLNMEDTFLINQNFLAAFITYLLNYKFNCKNDGTLKKNDLTRISLLFPGKEKLFQLLVTSFLNLSLLREEEKSYELDFQKIQNFAELPEKAQYCLLTAASVSRYSRDGLKKEAQLLSDCCSAIPENGFSKSSLLHLAFLIGADSKEGSPLAKRSRFAQILEAAKTQNEESIQNADLLDRMIDSAIEFGIFEKKGTDENQNEIYVNGLQKLIPLNPEQKVLNIDSTFSVTILPGLPLKNLLSLIIFLQLKKTGVATEFEITKQSISKAFDSGCTDKSIFAEIEKYSYYTLPQSLKINISEWYTNYTSVQIFNGYVLKVSENNKTIIENNPKIKNFIKEKIGDGIYFLNLPQNENLSTFLQESGLDLMGNIKTVSPKKEVLPFPVIIDRNSSLKTAAFSSASDNLSADGEKLTALLLKKLETMDFEIHQKENLKNRILNHLILSELQLSQTSIRTEILEADGMDFAGKLHLIEAAIKENDMMEIILPDVKNSENFITILGKPQILTKQTGEAVLRFLVEPSEEILNLLVSKITHLRRIKF